MPGRNGDGVVIVLQKLGEFDHADDGEHQGSRIPARTGRTCFCLTRMRARTARPISRFTPVVTVTGPNASQPGPGASRDREPAGTGSQPGPGASRDREPAGTRPPSAYRSGLSVIFLSRFHVTDATSVRVRRGGAA
jgi:hypothetical protein